MLYLIDLATPGPMNQEERAFLGSLAKSVMAEKDHQAERMDMSQSYLDLAYRRHLKNHYTKLGYDATRHYLDPNGNAYVTTPCYYCGLPSTSEDHQPPLATYHSLIVLGEPPPSARLYVVPACHECNSLLGSHYFTSLGSRKKYLKKRLRERYHKLLALPVWEETETRDMGHTLKDFIRLGEVQQEIVHERLAW